MSNKMLIDAAHPEETRVVVLRGNRVEDFDFESASKKPLRGNIYLAKVTRVEPSLQAAFIEYGGNRHGFLAFSEIHPDYYQIPVADRQALLDEEARAHREEEDEQRKESSRRSRRHRRGGPNEKRAAQTGESITEATEDADDEAVEYSPSEHETEPSGERIEAWSGEEDGGQASEDVDASASDDEADLGDNGVETVGQEPTSTDEADVVAQHDDVAAVGAPGAADGDEAADPEPLSTPPVEAETASVEDEHDDAGSGDEADHDEEAVEQLGGDAMEDVPYRAPRLRRHYKIQEVIKRRQILLVQVVKEERGNKGAALTTYLSLAGRYSVLMPNTARGGGISRKITDSEDRKRLKSIAHELDVPEGMGIILRTAGASRSESEVKRDFEYLLRMWETIRELTLRSSAPALVYEEGSLIKRAIRDLFTREMDEVCVAGDTAFREAKEFMRLLMPSHAKNVRLYTDSQPIFAKSGVEAQLDAMFSNHVTLRSGGYIVINQTEALVAIDVNSGRSTREHNIEDTALRTNLEAADEVARQLRLRDLAGLIVVDFIDMEESRNNRAVERRIKDALKNDRARIQIGRISHFGLLEMSRQRIRTGVLEGSTVLCPHCAGAGTVRSTSSIALHVLRVLEDTLIRQAEFNLIVRTRMEVALYILNQKRAHVSDLEQRFGVTIAVLADTALTGTLYHALERGEPATGAPVLFNRAAGPAADVIDADDDSEETIDEAADEAAEEDASDGPEPHQADGRRGEGDDQGERKRRRRRRRRGRDRESSPQPIAADADQPSDQVLGDLVGFPVGEARGDEAGDPGSTMASDDPDSAEIASVPDTLARPSEELDVEAQPDATETSLDEAPVEAVEPPRRRRSRRATPRAATPEVASETVAAVVDDAAPAPRRSRRSRSRAADEEVPTELPFAPPSADRDVGAPIAHTVTADEGPEASVETQPTVEPPTEEPPVAKEPATTAPTEPEPDRPKRSGWWQRAKASLTGT